jgi:hypothetical protein
VFRLVVGSTKSGSTRRKRAPEVVARLLLLLFVLAAAVCLVDDDEAFARPLLQLDGAAPAQVFVFAPPEGAASPVTSEAGRRASLHDPPPAPSLRAPPSSV